MLGHHNINVTMVLFIVVLSAMLQCNGIGNALHVEVTPHVAKEFETKLVEVKCVVNTTEKNHVFAISMGKDGKALAQLKESGVEYATEQEERIQAEGSIQQFLRLKIYDPKPSDSGLYMCHADLHGLWKIGEDIAYGKLTVKKQKSRCQADSVEWLEEKKCIKIYDKNLPFTSAKSFCESIDNGRLVKINNLAKQNFIANLPLKPELYWNGAKRVEHFFYPTGGFMNGTLFRWQRRQPDNYIDKQDCIELVAKYKSTKGVLNDMACRAGRRFLCEFPARYEGGKAICPKGQHLYDPERICISIHTNQLSYRDASAYCASFDDVAGRRLLELKDREMQDFVAGLPLDNLKYWIGAERRYSFLTLDGTPLAPNIRWEHGQPNHYLGIQDCLEFVADSLAEMNDERCGAKRYVICETDAVTFYE